MSHSTLPRVIGVPGVALTGFNCVVGVGIFGLPGIVAVVFVSVAALVYAARLALARTTKASPQIPETS